MRQFHLQFDGYWREINKRFLPEDSGIYLIYTCIYDQSHDTVELSKLIYIGQAENIRKRISDHNEEEFSSVLQDGETICYACAHVDAEDLDFVENALVFAEKPQCNGKLKESYSYDDAEFLIGGACGMITYTNYTITTKKDER